VGQDHSLTMMQRLLPPTLISSHSMRAAPHGKIWQLRQVYSKLLLSLRLSAMKCSVRYQLLQHPTYELLHLLVLGPVFRIISCKSQRPNNIT
jgi:hypothetical protein